MESLANPLPDDDSQEECETINSQDFKEIGDNLSSDSNVNFDENQEFVASLAAEDNANSLPSVKDAEESNEQLMNASQLIIQSQHDQGEKVASTESSDNALAEEIGNDDSNKTKADPDAEMVSEDELPVPQKEVVQDAVEVSDEELPCPKAAELPADAEAVSEDELPIKNNDESVNKRKRDDDGDDQGVDGLEKKSKVDSEETAEKKKLPDLDKYWKSVNDDPTDFTAWTYLLQYVDHEVRKRYSLVLKGGSDI